MQLTSTCYGNKKMQTMYREAIKNPFVVCRCVWILSHPGIDRVCAMVRILARGPLAA